MLLNLVKMRIVVQLVHEAPQIPFPARPPVTLLLHVHIGRQNVSRGRPEESPEAFIHDLKSFRELKTFFFSFLVFAFG